MASNYPGSLDSFDTIASDKKTSDAVGGRTHRAMHNDLGDAIESVQTELGTNPSGSDATVAARLSAIEAGTNLATGAVTSAKIANDTITATQVAANAIGSSELADNAVDTAAIADSAVTPAKLATSGRFVFPTGAANGYGFASGAVHLSGTGTPEGVITAAPGSTWLQTDSTTDVKGWIRWVKATGTGNTGWQAGPEADTGLRTIATALTPGSDITIHYAHIRRTGFVVTLSADVTFGGITTGSVVPLFTIPAGFQPHTILIRDTLAASSDGTPEVRNLFIRDADVALYGATSSKRYRFVLTWHTAGAWPTSLPGSAA